MNMQILLVRGRSLLGGCVMLLSAPLWASPATTYDFGQPAPAAKATRSIEVVMKDMSFTTTSLAIKAGETVRFVLINKGQLLHEFNLGTAAMHVQHQQEMLKMQQGGMLAPTAMAAMDHGSMGHGAMAGKDHGMRHDDPNSVLVEPGKQAELTWTFSKSGSLEFACNVPGHYQAGMVGKLMVSP
ncbi:plastocyanin/azurin family copper-binding protein [Pseudomonas sp. LD120]|uniref:copper-resistant cuproprotein CopI n=1 Tax=Pseudomonas sp. LD120 TaxID=485751 RepID=UPI00135A42A9|nr:cupredoxin family protein [Pseudomonas sp. LD120]KAF0863922.1 copper-binding protein [Pseudomonas sp. LD120]